MSINPRNPHCFSQIPLLQVFSSYSEFESCALRLLHPLSHYIMGHDLSISHKLKQSHDLDSSYPLSVRRPQLIRAVLRNFQLLQWPPTPYFPTSFLLFWIQNFPTSPYLPTTPAQMNPTSGSAGHSTSRQCIQPSNPKYFQVSRRKQRKPTNPDSCAIPQNNK